MELRKHNIRSSEHISSVNVIRRVMLVRVKGRVLTEEHPSQEKGVLTTGMIQSHLTTKTENFKPKKVENTSRYGTVWVFSIATPLESCLCMFTLYIYVLRCC